MTYNPNETELVFNSLKSLYRRMVDFTLSYEKDDLIVAPYGDPSQYRYGVMIFNSDESVVYKLRVSTMRNVESNRYCKLVFQIMDDIHEEYGTFTDTILKCACEKCHLLIFPGEIHTDDDCNMENIERTMDS